MAALPEDDGPTMTGTAGERRVDMPLSPIEDNDGEDRTTAEAPPHAPPRDAPPRDAPPRNESPRKAGARADDDTGAHDPHDPHDHEDRTVQQQVEPAGPVPSVQPAASSPPLVPTAGTAPADARRDLTGDDEPLEDSITTTAPRIGAAKLLEAMQAARGMPLSITGSVEIRDFEPDDLLDETEVRTRPGNIPLTIPAALRGSPAPPAQVSSLPSPSPRPAAGRPPSISPDTDSVAMAMARAAPAKGTDVSGSYANEDDDDDDEDSITTRAAKGRRIEADAEDSVTTQAPAVPLALMEAALSAPRTIGDATLDDATEGTTQSVRKSPAAALSSPADGEVESITAQAPGQLTNILRVIAAGSSPDLGSEPRGASAEHEHEDEHDSEDEDEQPENRTAVMANAPLKRILADVDSASALPAIRPTGGPLVHGPQGAAAPQLDPSSESGLRAARPDSGEHPSLGALGVGADGRDGHYSGVGRATGPASQGSISGPMDMRAHAHTELAPFQQGSPSQPSLHDVDLGKGPRYGLLVGVVAVISLVVPALLFLVLRSDPETLDPGVPAAPASELEKHDGARIKVVRGKNGVMTPAASGSAAASTAPSAKPSPGSKGFPFKR